MKNCVIDRLQLAVVRLPIEAHTDCPARPRRSAAKQLPSEECQLVGRSVAQRYGFSFHCKRPTAPEASAAETARLVDQSSA